MSIPSRLQLTVVVLVAAVIWAALLVLGDVVLPMGFFKPLSKVVGILVLLLGAFEVWLWKWVIFRGWLVKRPNLIGTWRAQLRSSWVDPSSGKTLDVIDAFLVVQQTYSTCRTKLLTEESTSEQLGCELTRLPDGYRLSAVYRNEPKIFVQGRSRIHHGAVLLAVHNHPVSLEGHYWTDRQTSGELRTTSKVKRRFPTYSAARANWKS
jgi:hypothetical protein